MSNPWLSPTVVDQSAQQGGQQGYEPPPNPWTGQPNQGMWGTQPQQQATEQQGGSSGYNPMYAERNAATEGAAAGDTQSKQKSSGLMGALDNPAVNFATSVGGALATQAVSGAGLTAATMGGALATGVATFGIGLVAGAIIGKILGGKEKTPRMALASGDVGMNSNAYEDGYMVKSRLATIGLSDGGTKYVNANDPAVHELVNGIAELDNVIADYIGQEGIDAITKTMMQENPKKDGSIYGWQTAEINDRTLRDRYEQMLGHASAASPAAMNASRLVQEFESELFKIVNGGYGVSDGGGVQERIAELKADGAVEGKVTNKGVMSALRENFDAVRAGAAGDPGSAAQSDLGMTQEQAKDRLFGSGGAIGKAVVQQKVTPESLEDDWQRYYEANGGKPAISKELFMKYVPKYRQQKADYETARRSSQMLQNEVQQWKDAHGGQPPENYEGMGMGGYGYNVTGQIRTESDMYMAQSKAKGKSDKLKTSPRGVSLDLEDFVPVMIAGLQGYTMDDIRNGRGSPSSPYTPGSQSLEASVSSATSDAATSEAISGSNYLDYMRSIAPKEDIEAAARERSDAAKTVVTRHDTTPTYSFYQGYIETIAEQDQTQYAPNEGIEDTYTVTNQKHKPETTRSFYEDYVRRTKQNSGGLQ